MGRDMIVPPHTVTPHTTKRGSTTHANKPTPEAQARKQASRDKRGGGTTPPPPPQTNTPTPRKRKHPKRTQAVTQTPNPTTHRANTPTSKPQQGTPPSEHKKRPRQSAWASKMCERRRTRVPRQGRPARSKAGETPTRAGTQKQAHTRRARKQRGLRRSGAALRPPDGGETRAKGRSQ